jgi:hypothetical protein
MEPHNRAATNRPGSAINAGMTHGENMKNGKNLLLLHVFMSALFFLVTCLQPDDTIPRKKPVIIVKIEITSGPVRKIYYVGDSMTAGDLAGLEVTAVFSDDSQKIIPLDDLEITGFDTTEVTEKQNITVTYKDKTAKFAITVNPVVVTGIKIVRQPTKTVYLTGDTAADIDLSGLEVIAFYNNTVSSPVPITVNDITGFDSSRPGKKTLTVTYQGKTAEFTVNVSAVVLTALQITGQPDKTVYYVGDALTDNDLSGLEVTAHYSNGTSSPVTVTVENITGFNSSVTGNKNLTVTYQQKTAVFSIRVDEGILSGIRIARVPVKKNYKMGEELVTNDLIVENVYHNGYTRTTDDFTIIGDTFTAGSVGITVASKINDSKTASFNINVSNELINTGLPVVYIETRNVEPIVSKDDWINMRVKVVSDNPGWSFEKTDYRDQIKGRGNTSWGYPKKPYRMRFCENTSMFGLTAARDWVLLADYKVATLMSNTIAFELGQRFDGPLFKNNYVYVDVVVNGNYKGAYILTEHMRFGEGRVEIDKNNGYLVELDVYYDKDPKFKTPNLNLPVMIVSPDFGANIADPHYQFVIDSFNEYDALLSDVNFPNNNWQDIIDIDSFVDYLMINEIVYNGELGWPKSIYMCKEAGKKIKMSHLWDFDWSFGLGGGLSVNVSTAKGRFLGGQFSQFHNDENFRTKYKARWNEKYSEIQSMLAFIDTTTDKIRVSHSLNNKRWYNGVYNFDVEAGKLKTWWSNRIDYLNSAINSQ